jgi:hypothetical protein
MSSGHLNITLPPARLPSRLFLYGLHTGPGGHPRSAAAIGLLDSAGFNIVHVYPPGTFGIWSGVHAAARNGIRWLLFLTHDGSAATGTIDRNFAFAQAKTFAPAAPPTDWRRAAVDGNGELLLTASLTTGTTTIGFGQVDSDGTFIVWWKSQVPLPSPEKLLGLPNAHAWLTITNGTQPTSTVSLLHRGTIVGSRTWNEQWTGMAVHGNLLAVYRGVRQFPIPTRTHTTPPHYEVCRVTADHQITTVWNYEDFPPAIANTVGTDINTSAGILFYQFAIGSNVAEVRSLTERGFVRTAALGELRQIVPDLPDTGLGWLSIVPC